MVTLGVIEFNQAAYDSKSQSQLSALALRRLGKATLLEWVARRVNDSEQLDKVIVVVGEGRLTELARQCTPPSVTLFVSPETNATARLVSAAHRYNADSLVRVCVNNPFIDPVLIDRLVAAAKQEGGCDYVALGDEEGNPLEGFHGMHAEWFSTAALERAAKAGPDASRIPPQAKTLYIPAPPALAQEDVRLTIDVEEDWEHAQVIYDALDERSLDWQGITGLLNQQPAMRKRMAVLNRTA